MSIIENFLAEYKNYIFVETGTYKGDGVQMALDAGFPLVISIEAEPTLWGRCFNRFADNLNVICLHGDSTRMLGETIQGFNVPITFFLDAHPCGDAYFGEGNPLVRTYQGHSSIEAELDQIARHHIKRHTIMIDDWKVFGSSKIIEKIREINRDYNIEYREGNYKNDILIASV